jgi:DNA-binding transcriptional ArsR family regulator
MDSDPPAGRSGPEPAPPTRRVDATALLGLAHPLRVRIYDELAARGPATSSELARRLGESSGATSYHLRQLARHGFIEEDAGRGTRRERWWRDRPGSTQFPMELSSSPATREAARLVLGEWHRSRIQRFQHAHATTPTWDEAWQDAFVDVTAFLRLRAEELASMGGELLAVVQRWKESTRDRPDDGTLTDVEVQFTAFPIDPPQASLCRSGSEPADE